MSTKAEKDNLWIQVVYGHIKPKLIQLGIYLPQYNLSTSIVSRAEMDRLLRRPSNGVTGLTVSRGVPFGMSHYVYILDGMSPCLFKETLAHECGHVWLNDRNSRLNRSGIQEVEGFCNLLAYKVLLFEFSEESKTTRQNMLDNPDPIYGDGFRMMKQRADMEGWSNFLARIS